MTTTRVRKIFALWPRKFGGQTYWLENIALTEELRSVPINYHPAAPIYIDYWEITNIRPIRHCR
mgnify:CR=1 FL=1